MGDVSRLPGSRCQDIERPPCLVTSFHPSSAPSFIEAMKASVRATASLKYLDSRSYIDASQVLVLDRRGEGDLPCA